MYDASQGGARGHSPSLICLHVSTDRTWGLCFGFLASHINHTLSLTSQSLLDAIGNFVPLVSSLGICTTLSLKVILWRSGLRSTSDHEMFTIGEQTTQKVVLEKSLHEVLNLIGFRAVRWFR